MPEVVVDGVHLHYEEHGTGVPVVLIHGAAGSGKQFDDAIAHAGDGYRLLVPDLRGMGRSDRVAGLLDPADWVSDVSALLDAAGVERAVLIGLSLGARVAARVAIDHPGRVLGLVVDAPIIATDVRAGSSLRAGMTAIPDDSEAAAAYRLHHGTDWRAVVETFLGSRDEPSFQEYLDLREAIPGMATPTLITRGDIDDPVHPLQHCFEWHRMCPASWLWIAPDTRSSAVSRPEPFWAHVAALVAAVTTAV